MSWGKTGDMFRVEPPLMKPDHTFDKPNVEVRNVSGKGRGVFAKELILQDTLVEEAPFIILFQNDVKGELLNYIWGYDDTRVAMPLGYVSLYNHSKNNNLDVSMSGTDQRMLVRANRNIGVGQELLVSYGDSWMEQRGYEEI